MERIWKYIIKYGWTPDEHKLVKHDKQWKGSTVYEIVNTTEVIFLGNPVFVLESADGSLRFNDAEEIYEIIDCCWDKEDENMTIEETLRIAIDAHEGQKDLDGKPAILHPIAVGLMGQTEAEIKTGFLHDVIEDSDLTLDDLANMGVDAKVVEALALLSHDKTTDYFDYVQKLIDSENTTAKNVKLNDLRHNLQRGKLSYEQALTDGDSEKVANLTRINAKHEKALKMFAMNIIDK